ncbi:MAG: DUF438 domain-containing protein [Candidatus Thorarchaeota archaeon SMTZ1-45]|nr:MAG: hypothetical protein AM325_08065 [Candidatus Thorarchaeota archaeon SMTZ1-45]
MASERKNILKEIAKRIDVGEDTRELKKDFVKTLGVVNPAEMMLVKDELIREGLSNEVFQTLYNMSLEVFRDTVQAQKPIVPKGHPIHTLMSEHALLMEYANELHSLTKTISEEESEPNPAYLDRIRQLLEFFGESTTHYLREENALFPVLEKHGLTGPPAAMWSEHQEIHEIEKGLFDLNSDSNKELIENLGKLSNASTTLANMLASHFNKENNILFPASLRLFGEQEWEIVIQDFDDIGYCSYSIKPVGIRAPVQVEKPIVSEGSEVVFGSGKLSVDTLEAIFKHLPIDMTFVDAQDRVQFFSESPDRIFVRSRAVIGRSVQLCHPKKSVHVVEQILNDFRKATRDSAEFWINLGGKTIHIRYFAVRDSEKKYLGCLEVSQDITEILKISGEKRLLD